MNMKRLAIAFLLAGSLPAAPAALARQKDGFPSGEPVRRSELLTPCALAMAQVPSDPSVAALMERLAADRGTTDVSRALGALGARAKPALGRLYCLAAFEKTRARGEEGGAAREAIERIGVDPVDARRASAELSAPSVWEGMRVHALADTPQVLLGRTRVLLELFERGAGPEALAAAVPTLDSHYETVDEALELIADLEERARPAARGLVEFALEFRKDETALKAEEALVRIGVDVGQRRALRERAIAAVRSGRADRGARMISWLESLERPPVRELPGLLDRIAWTVESAFSGEHRLPNGTNR